MLVVISTPSLSATANHTNKQPVGSGRSKAKTATQMKMSCDKCSVSFSIFKRKKCCQECHRYFCSKCLPKPHSSSVGRQCSKCCQLMSGHFSRDDLQTWKVNDMRCFLNVRNISTKDCREKHDLIELVVSRFCTHPRQSAQDQAEHESLVQQMAAHVRDVSFVSEPTSIHTSSEDGLLSHRSTESGLSPTMQYQASSSTTAASESVASANEPLTSALDTTSVPTQESSEGTPVESSGDGSSSHPRVSHQDEEELGFNLEYGRIREFLESVLQTCDQKEDNVPAEPVIRRAHLDDIIDLSEIADLSVRQLKELLVNNFVDYKGCCEKAELVEKTKRLWKDHQENKLRAERIHKQEEAAYSRSQQTVGVQKDVVVPGEDKRDSETLTRITTTTEPMEKGEDSQVSAGTDIESEETAAEAACYKPAPTASTGDVSSEPAPAASTGDVSSEPASIVAIDAMSLQPAPAAATGDVSSEPAPAAAMPSKPASTVAVDAVSSQPAPAATTGDVSSKPVPAAIDKSSKDSGSRNSDSLCHICMDSLVNCILLECGHMVTCTQCGKRLAECPVCRQYIVRVVRVFRS